MRSYNFPVTARPVITETDVVTQLYRSRYLMLFLFVLCSMSNAFQWTEYAIITSIVSEYYDVGELAINWTCMIYMASYVPLILPANWYLEKKGLRSTILLGSFGTCLGSWVKCGSLSPDRFLVSMLGQTIVAVSQVFILGIPSQLAGTWFSAEEVSRACAVGVFGNQLGIALGFVLPPVIVTNSPIKEDITKGLGRLFYTIAGITSVICIVIVFFFQEKPLTPPSKAQAAIINLDSKHGYWSSILKLICNVHYILLLVSYGINVGVFYAISTLLNQMVLEYYPGAEEDAGWMGLTIVTFGMLGSVVCGIILDKTHKFKEIILAVYIFSLCGLIAFTLALRYGNMWSLFLTAGLLGFFMTGYLPLGFEFAVELTYPEAESISSGLLNASAQVFGIIFTSGASAILENYGDWVANLCLSLTLVVGCLVTSFIKPDLRRLKASQMPNPAKYFANVDSL